MYMLLAYFGFLILILLCTYQLSLIDMENRGRPMRRRYSSLYGSGNKSGSGTRRNSPQYHPIPTHSNDQLVEPSNQIEELKSSFEDNEVNQIFQYGHSFHSNYFTHNPSMKYSNRFAKSVEELSEVL